MIQTISKKVRPNEEQATINIMSCFGWSVKSSQEINSKESHLERRGDEIYSVSTKENYVKLLFERNTEMKNYAQISQLEQKYNALCASTKPKFEKKQIILTLVLTVVFFPIGIGYGAYTFFTAAKNAQNTLRTLAAPILSEARSLL